MIYMPEKVYIIENGEDVRAVKINSWTKKDFSVEFYDGKFILSYMNSYICYETREEAQAVIDKKDD